ncbi:MAG TPA: phosphatase PAP2 family protein [Dissulfurispiraceae bacterium]|nr:phosphatase PAP2 family protein [Dissulfurispiraceae bacterium]
MKRNELIVSLAALVPLSLIYIDEPVLTWVRTFHGANPDVSQFLRLFDKIMYYAAHGTTMIVGAFLYLLYGRYVNRELQDSGKSLLIGLVASGLSVQLLKHLIGRARPRITDSLVIIGPSLKGSYDSFPSGHSAMAFCLAAVLTQHYPKYWILFYLFAVFEGLARIDGTSHFPGDVLAGAVLGTLIARLVETGLARRNRTASGCDSHNLDKFVPY